MCLHKMADRLYTRLQGECEAHIGGQLARLAAEQTMDPVLFLAKVRL
jgi:cullin-4